MTAKDLIIEHSEYDLNNIVADINEIRRYIPQRFEMEQLTAIVHEDFERNICVGYKDYGPNEFWVRGHLPGMPVLPGVMMCEAAAQLCTYYATKYGLMEDATLGFGGLDDVRFRDMVLPGDRLVVVSTLVKFRRGAIIVSRFQGFVRESLACEGQIKGIALPVDALKKKLDVTR